MKVITATLLGKIKTDYAFDGIKFSFCSAPMKRHVKQLTEWRTCREDLMDILRSCMIRQSTRIDKRKTRLLAYIRAPHSTTKIDGEKHYAKERKRAYTQMQASLELIQYFERRLGWPLSRMYKVDQKTSPLASIHMIVGSSRWQKSTHYFSLYLLMLRLGKSGFRGKYDDHKALMAKLEAFGRRRCNDAGFVKATYLKWELFLQNQDKLFTGRNLKNIFKRSSLAQGNTGYNEGINQLCVGWSRDLVLTSRFRKLCEENGMKQEEHVAKRLKE